MQALSDEYDKRHSATKDRFKCDDIVEIHRMAKEASKGVPDSMFYFLITFALQAGFMKGYRSAKYEIRKRKG